MPYTLRGVACLASLCLLSKCVACPQWISSFIAWWWIFRSAGFTHTGPRVRGFQQVCWLASLAFHALHFTRCCLLGIIVPAVEVCPHRGRSTFDTGTTWHTRVTGDSTKTSCTPAHVLSGMSPWACFPPVEGYKTVGGMYTLVLTGEVWSCPGPLAHVGECLRGRARHCYSLSWGHE